MSSKSFKSLIWRQRQLTNVWLLFISLTEQGSGYDQSKVKTKRNWAEFHGQFQLLKECYSYGANLEKVKKEKNSVS